MPRLLHVEHGLHAQPAHLRFAEREHRTSRGDGATGIARWKLQHAEHVSGRAHRVNPLAETGGWGEVMGGDGRITWMTVAAGAAESTTSVIPRSTTTPQRRQRAPNLLSSVGGTFFLYDMATFFCTVFFLSILNEPILRALAGHLAARFLRCPCACVDP